MVMDDGPASDSTGGVSVDILDERVEIDGDGEGEESRR